MRESTVQAEIAAWLKKEYPGLRFDVRPYGVKPGRGTIKGLGNGWPDISVYACRGRFGGLYLEVKKDREEIFAANGDLKNINTESAKRLKNQVERLQYFRAAGYWGDFVCSTLEANALICWYMQLPFAVIDDGKNPPPFLNLK